jgi:CBS domain-containing protein
MQAVRDIMTTDVVTLDPDMTLREAAATLADHHVTGAPVVINGRVIGVLSASDILGADAVSPVEDDGFDPDSDDVGDDEPAPFFARLWPDAAMDVSERFGARSRDERSPVRSALDDRTVSDAMTRGVLAIGPDETISYAAGRMASACVHRLLVVDDDGLAGIVTTSDIARWLAGRLRSAR